MTTNRLLSPSTAPQVAIDVVRDNLVQADARLKLMGHMQDLSRLRLASMHSRDLVKRALEALKVLEQ